MSLVGARLGGEQGRGGCPRVLPHWQRIGSRREVHHAFVVDIHEHVDGLTSEAVAEAHRLDLETQQRYGVRYLRYWYDTESGKVFCLVEAPDQATAARVHQEAHGLVADHLYEVREGS